jgi:hypothetical protein
LEAVVEIKGLTSLLSKLKAKVAAVVAGSGSHVIVGYTAAYAVFVHENLEAYHKVGQAKFLEAPARRLTGDGTLAKIIEGAVRSGKTPNQAMLLAGLRLQRESQKLTPIDTGNLRNSAFTRLEE